VPVIWQYCLYVEECASDLAEFSVMWRMLHANNLAELPVCGQECAFDLAELPVSGQCVSDLAELPVSG
jgi:hypothetical protein